MRLGPLGSQTEQTSNGKLWTVQAWISGFCDPAGLKRSPVILKHSQVMLWVASLSYQITKVAGNPDLHDCDSFQRLASAKVQCPAILTARKARSSASRVLVWSRLRVAATHQSMKTSKPLLARRELCVELRGHLRALEHTLQSLPSSRCGAEKQQCNPKRTEWSLLGVDGRRVRKQVCGSLHPHTDLRGIIYVQVHLCEFVMTAWIYETRRSQREATSKMLRQMVVDVWLETSRQPTMTVDDDAPQC